MNKELILKYKTEFDHWLNDKEVLACPIKNKLNGYAVDWQPIDKNALWDNENIAYIINDEYAELRKAQAEGKTIQFKPSIDSDFKDINMSLDSYIKEYPHFGVSRYRIKPEEPKFKVGDWITLDGEICKILKDNGATFRVKVYKPLEKSHPDYLIQDAFKEHTQKWQPKPSQWCWCSIFGLIKIICEATENGNPCYLCWNPWKKLEQKLTNLEPFIGELPSHLKD